MPSIGVAVCPTRVATSGATVDVPATAAEPSMNPSWSHLRHAFSNVFAAAGAIAGAVAGFEPERGEGGSRRAAEKSAAQTMLLKREGLDPSSAKDDL